MELKCEAQIKRCRWCLGDVMPRVSDSVQLKFDQYVAVRGTATDKPHILSHVLVVSSQAVL